jgi:hypothetical protein
MIGLAGIGFAAIVALMLIVLRSNGINQLGPWGIFAVFSAAVLGVAGVSLFSLGAMFNYLVSLFQKKVEQRGLFGKPIFNPPLDRQFWWIGGLAVIVGFVVGVGTLVLGFNGWTLNQLWLWMLASAMSTIVGIQLIVSWIVMRVLEEVSIREVKQASDMLGNAKRSE